MPYIKEICKAGKTIEIRKYHTYRYDCKGEKRQKKKKDTTECQKKVNYRISERNLRRLMNANFEDGDFLVTFDFIKENRPSNSKSMQDVMKKFLRVLRKEIRKIEGTLKYIYVKEIGKRGAVHVHMIMTKCDTKILRKCWIWGGIHIDPLYTNGQYSKIASYFVKYAQKSEETEGELVGKRYYTSRDLVRPVVVKRVMKGNTFTNVVNLKQGYYIDKENTMEGITEDGYRYLMCTMVRAG